MAHPSTRPTSNPTPSVPKAVPRRGAFLFRRIPSQHKSLLRRLHLAIRNINILSLARQAESTSVPRREAHVLQRTIRRPELRVRHLAPAVRPASTREEADLVARFPSGIGVQAGLRERADYQNESVIPVVVFTRGDDVPALAGRASAGCGLDGRQVGAEVARGGVDEEAVAV